MLKSCFYTGLPEAGCDEAGRGCLAGPVFAAAVMFPEGYKNESINDSKKLKEETRKKLREEIKRDALAWAVAWKDNDEIDRVNILRASVMAMHEALDKLEITPLHIIVDGNFFVPYHTIPYSCIVKGDSTYLSIAAASILAKTFRDEYMIALHEKHKHYGWDTNKGYATGIHREAIRKFGLTTYHRKSFVHFNNQLNLNL